MRTHIEKRFTENQRDNMVRRYLAGEKLTIIAAHYGCDQSYPSQLARRHGWASRRARNKCPKCPHCGCKIPCAGYCRSCRAAYNRNYRAMGRRCTPERRSFS